MWNFYWGRDMSQNDVVKLAISELGARGDGMASYEGEPVYIAYGLPGDIVEATLEREGKNAWRGVIQTIITPSPVRIAPICQHFGTCGGCALQHMKLETYSDWAKDRIGVALSQHGLEDIPTHDIALSPQGSRRRLDLKAMKTGSGVALGYHTQKSTKLINLLECPVAKPDLVAVFDPLRSLLAGLLKSGQGAGVRLLDADTGIGVQIGLPGEPDLDARMDLAEFAEHHDLAGLWIDVGGFREPVAVRRALQVKMGAPENPVLVDVKPDSFLQASKDGEQALNHILSGQLSGCGHVLDLFAGLGTFALPIAAGAGGNAAHVCAVEGDMNALELLGAAANRSAGVLQVERIHRDLFRRPMLPQEMADFDAIIIDPPRAGAKAQMAEIALSRVPVVMAVSCNPNTFARDARILVDGGYQLVEIWPVGQFLFSHHVELIAKFTR